MIAESRETGIGDAVVAQREHHEGLIGCQHRQEKQQTRVSKSIVVDIQLLQGQVLQRSELRQNGFINPVCDADPKSTLSVAQTQYGEIAEVCRGKGGDGLIHQSVISNGESIVQPLRDVNFAHGMKDIHLLHEEMESKRGKLRITTLKRFHLVVREVYHLHGRELAHAGTHMPYSIIV